MAVLVVVVTADAGAGVAAATDAAGVGGAVSSYKLIAGRHS